MLAVVHGVDPFTRASLQGGLPRDATRWTIIMTTVVHPRLPQKKVDDAHSPGPRPWSKF